MRLTGRVGAGFPDYSQIETQGTSLLSLNGQKATRSRGRAPSPLTKKTNLRSPGVRHADELMDLAVEAAESRHLSSFLEQCALRATRMLEAGWGAVVVYKGRETEFHEMAGKPGSTSQSVAEWLLSNARDARAEIETRTLPTEIAACFEDTEGA